MEMDTAIRRRGECSIQSDGKRNMQLVNGAVHRDLVPISRERDVCKRRTCNRTGVEVVADVADVGVNDASLDLKNEGLWLIERRVDVLVGPPHLSIQPANVNAKIWSLPQHQVVRINAGWS